MLLRTEILHDFDTFSPSPHVSLKKKKKKASPARDFQLRLPRIHHSLGGLEFVFRPPLLPTHSPLPVRPPVADFWFPLSGGVRPWETEHEASFSLEGPKHSSMPRAMRGRGRAAEFAATVSGGAERLLGDRPPSGRIGLSINASRQRSAPRGVAGQGMPSCGACVFVCVRRPLARFRSFVCHYFQNASKTRGWRKSSEIGKGSPHSKPGPYS